jgi:hypothetical protein
MGNIFTPKDVVGFLEEWKYRETLPIDEEETVLSSVKGGKIVAGEKGVIRVVLEPETMYDVKVEAIDDPSDSDSAVTADPMKFLTEFMSTGHGDEYLSGMAFVRPSDVVVILRRVAEELSSGQWHKVALKRYMRRVVAGLPKVAQSEFEKMNVDNLQSRMKKKGWDVSTIGELELEVNIGDVYKANIEMDSVLWSYEITVMDLKDSGTTDWPIREIGDFLRRDDVISAVKSAKKEKRRQERSVEKTVPPSGKPTLPTIPT